MRLAGIDITGKRHGPHSLRHSLATGLLEDKTPLPVIAAALGHNSTKNTSRYLRIDIERLRSIALEIPIMNNNYSVVSFKDGVFKELFLQFIQYKQGLGFQYGHSIQSYLLRINSSLNEWQLESPILTKDMVECIVVRRSGEAPATQQKRASLLRHFAEFMNDMGYQAYVYPAFYNVKWIHCFVPYIFSQSQLQSVFSAADSLKPIKRSPLYDLV